MSASKYKTRTDPELVSMCLNGDALAWEVLITRYKRLIYSVPVKFGFPSSDANDVFIQYTVVIGTGAAQQTVQDIALVEMAGDRIARIRDYMSPIDSAFQLKLAKSE